MLKLITIALAILIIQKIAEKVKNIFRLSFPEYLEMGPIMSDVSPLLSSLKKVKKLSSRKHAESYSALCPCLSHSDKTPSLCVDVTHTGKILIYCRAGCSTAAVLESVGLNMADLFPDNDYKRPPGYKPDEIDHALIVSQICQSDLKNKKTPKREDLEIINRALKILLFTKNLLEKNHAP